jgi:hypothetical protein
MPDLTADGNDEWLREQERLLTEFRALAELPCSTGKQKHGSKREANAQAASLRSKGDRTRTGAFLCGMCGHWHVGRR